MKKVKGGQDQSLGGVTDSVETQPKHKKGKAKSSGSKKRDRRLKKEEQKQQKMEAAAARMGLDTDKDVYLDEEDFDGEGSPVFFHIGTIDTIVAQVISPHPSVLTAQFPRALRPPPAPPQPVPRDANHQPGRNPGRPANQGRDQPQRQPLRPNQDIQNTQFAQPFRDFWDTVPPARQNEGIQSWLRAANSSPVQSLLQLGLTANDCAMFHIRGNCRRRGCNRRHVPQQLQATAVNAVCVLIRSGFQATA